jgi:UDP-2,3-diacylglucosamine pyrophosphatase LpxH
MSDLHLGSGEANEEALEAFLGSIESGRLIFAGDLWEYWGHSVRALRRRYEKFVNILRVLRTLGVQVQYVLGNHDAKYAKNPVIKEEKFLPWSEELDVDLPDGRKLVVIHGHQFDVEMSRVSCRAWLGNRVGLFRRWACPSTWRTSVYPDTFEKMLGVLHLKAKDLYMPKGYNGVIYGHTHVAEELREGNWTFYGCGSWARNTSYIEIVGSQIKIRRYL